MRRNHLAAAAAAIAVGALTLTACSGTTSGQAQAFTPQITTQVAAATTPVESVTWNLPYGEPSSLDPAQSALESNSTVVANMCESLFTQTTDGTTQPGLAVSIDQPNDLTYVISLRDGVTFWDGSPMTAEDVAYSINRILDPETASSWAMWAIGGATVEATGDLEVTVTLDTPYAMLQDFFATPAFAVVQKAFTENAGADFGTANGGVMCTGPYMFDSWTSGTDIVLTKNPAWWNTEQPVLVDSATFTFTAATSAQLAALRSGSIDGQFSAPVAGYSSLSEQGNLLFNVGYGTTFLSIANRDGALGDVNVRAALKSVVDYEGIVAGVFLGTAEPIRATVPPAAWGYSEEIFQAAWDALPPAEQNRDAIADLLAQSGYDGSEIVLAYPSDSEAQTKIATVIANGAQGSGLNVTLKPLQSAEYAAAFYSEEGRAGIDTMLVIGYLDFPEPAEYLQYSMTDSYYNTSGYSNPEFDAVMYQALAELDDDARAELLTQAQAILVADVASVPLVSEYVNVYYSSDLAGLVPSPSYLYSPWLTLLGGK